MVSKRQKLAKNRYREANPDLFPVPEPTLPKDSSKKKKKSIFKRKSSEAKNSNKVLRKKHPLRVAGMKPGESCYICKAPDHIAKNCPNKSEWEKNKICLSCRRRGHSLKNCPEKLDTAEKKLCYNCGETGHSLFNCSQPLQDGGTRFAKCFICSQSGHLSKDCPQSTHGIYPKGGCCKICGGVTHLAKDCPNKSSRSSDAGSMNSQSFEFQDRPNKITRFSSGDDLEDDFTSIPIPITRDTSSKETGNEKKQGTKVVNFAG